jgi:hypothetical protein
LRANGQSFQGKIGEPGDFHSIRLETFGFAFSQQSSTAPGVEAFDMQECPTRQ